MKFRKLLSVVCAVLMLFSCASTVEQKNTTITQVTEHTLNNGLYYAIHSKPENSGKIQLRLMIKSGSLSETDAQSGYAHLVEHMAFNGTEHFPKNKIIELFEKAGLTFGNDINAETNFSKTTYTLSIPRSDKKLLARVLLYFQDILTNITFDNTELDKEKGVVENEYRMSTFDEKHYFEAIFDDYIKGSEYAKRLPIGTLKSIENSTSDSLKKFYKEWYRPNNAKLLITGDVDSKNTQQLINKIFSSIEKSNNNTQQTIPKPPILKMDPKAYTSKVIDFSETDLYFELPASHIKNSKDLSIEIQFGMLKDLINYRLDTVNNKREKPFANVAFSSFEPLKNKRWGNVYVEHLNGENLSATKFMAQELARIKQHGFSKAEYNQQLEKLHSSQVALSDYYMNRDSQEIADDVINSWSQGDVVYSLPLEEKAYQIASKTTLQQLNQLAKELLNSPMKLTTAIRYQASMPNLLKLKQTFIETLKKPIDDIDVKIEKLTLPIIKNNVSETEIIKEKFYPKKQITQWHLKNGVDVVLQPEHSVKNEINMSFSAPGGYNTFTGQEVLAKYFLINSYTKTGLAGLSAQTLQQKLEQKNIAIRPYIEGNSAGFSMHSPNKQDSVKLLFSILHSALIDATVDSNIFNAEKKQVIEQQENSFKSPHFIFLDKVTEKLFPNNSRQKTASILQLQSVHKKDIENLYRRLFATVNGYKLTIVGDFNVAEIKPIILQYIATLPTGKAHKFSKISQSLITKPTQLNETTNPQNNALLLFDTITYTPNHGIKSIYQAKLMQRIISQILTKIVREKLSLTYSPYVSVEDQPIGQPFTGTIISLTTKVEDAQQTQRVVNNIIKNLLNKGITQKQLNEQKKSVQTYITSALGELSNKEEFLHRDHLFGYTLGSTEDYSGQAQPDT